MQLADVPKESVEDFFSWSTREELGRGGYGVVYKATCTASRTAEGFAGIQAGSSYAVKAVLKDERMFSFLRREVSILRQLDSECFVKLYYAFQDFSTVFLVEELFQGRELLDVIVQKNMLTEQIAADVARQLLEGLVYLHSRDIVHRDLKLENVLVQEDPQSGKLRLKVRFLKKDGGLRDTHVCLPTDTDIETKKHM